MKDGSTHLAHKAEHVVDLQTGALLDVSLHEADKGDTQTVAQSVSQAFEQVSEAIENTGEELPEKLFEELVTDKGYHANDTLVELQEELGIRTYVSEPGRGNRKWEGQPGGAEAKKAVYANRRRVTGARGKRLQRLRGEKLERSNAHMYETGGMRRVHLRGHENILKRLIVHAAGFNLGLLLLKVIGIGKPRSLQGRRGLILRLFLCLLGMLASLAVRRRPLLADFAASPPPGRSGGMKISSSARCLKTRDSSTG
jgi:transposase